MGEHTRDQLGEIAALLASLRDDTETAIIIGLGAHGPSFDSRVGHFSATVTSDGVTETSEAVHLHDAILLARAKVAATIERERKKREEAKKPIMTGKTVLEVGRG